MSVALRYIFLLFSLIVTPLTIANTLRQADNFSAFIFEDFVAPHGDADGALFVGGNLKINGYSIGDALARGNPGYALIVGKDIQFPVGRIYHGNVLISGDSSGMLYSVREGMTASQRIDSGPLPVDLNEIRSHLARLSSRMADYTSNGKVKFEWGGYYLTGDGASNVQVFTIDANKLEKAHTFAVSGVPDNATVIFNIYGDNNKDVIFFDGLSLADLIPHKRRTIFNFPDALNIEMKGIAVEGTVLAPHAHILAPHGDANGTVIAKSWSGAMHLTHERFEGDLSFLNRTPEIISLPSEEVNENELYHYPAQAIDPDNDPLSWSLVKSAPGMAIDAATGELSWKADPAFADGLMGVNGYCSIPRGTETKVQGYADILVAMDESGSMSGEQRWLASIMPALEESLLVRGVGTNTSNLYGAAGFYTSSKPRKIATNGEIFVSSAKFSEITRQFSLWGGTEDGWYASHVLLNEYPLREDSAKNIILVTDEDRDNTNGAITYDSLKDELTQKKVILNAVVNAGFVCGDGQSALGLMGNNVGLVAQPDGSYTTCENAKFSGVSDGTTYQNYVQLALDTGGAAWDLNYLRRGGIYAQAFTKAFIDIKVNEIVEQLPPVPQPDLVVSAVGFSPVKAAQTVVDISVSVSNRGLETYGLPVTLELFTRDYNGAEVLLGTQTLTLNLASGGSQPVLFEGITTSRLFDTVGVRIVGQDPSLECLSNNNETVHSLVVVQVSDGWGGFDSQLYQLKVNNINDAPKINNTPQNTVFELGNTFTYQPLVHDPDLGETFDFKLENAPVGMTINERTGEISWDTSNAQPGTYNLRLVATDTGGNVVTQDISVTVTFKNQPPQIISVAPKLTQVGSLYEYDVQVSDSNLVDEHSFSLVSAPALSTISRQTGLISWTPDINEATLSSGLSPKICSVTGAADQAPDLAITELSYDDNSDELIATITNGGQASSSAGLSLAFYVQPPSSQPNTVTSFANIVLPEIATGKSRDVRVKAAGNILGNEYVYAVADAEYQQAECDELNNQVKARVFHVKVEDTAGASDSQRFVVVARTNNQAPTLAVIADTSIEANQPYSLLIKANDTNSSDVLSYELLQSPAGMSINSTNGKVSWTPGQDQIGNHTVEYSVTDNAGAMASGSHTVTVIPENKKPVFTSTMPLDAQAWQEYSYKVEVTDPDGDHVELVLDANAPANMTLSANDVLQWLPDDTQVGNQTIRLIATDSEGGKTIQQGVVNVQAALPNKPPVVNLPSNLTAYAEEKFSFTLDAKDPEGFPLSYSLQGGIGNMAIDQLGVFSWVPEKSAIGSSANFKILVSDNRGATVTVNLQVPVNRRNTAPYVTNSAPQKAKVGALYEHRFTAEDKEGDSFSFKLLSAPAGVRLLPDGLLSWQPQSSEVGLHHIVFRVIDQPGAWQQIELPVLVEAASENEAPVITSRPQAQLLAGNAFKWQVTAFDPDGDALSYQLTVPSILGMQISPVGEVSWNTAGVSPGHYQFGIEVSDGKLSTIANYQLELVESATNLAPVIKSQPQTLVSIGETWHYQVLAIDAENDALFYTVTSSTSGIRVDASGMMSWTPSVPEKAEVLLTVSDGKNKTNQRFTVEATDQTLPLTVDVIISPDVIEPGTPISVSLNITGGKGEAVVDAKLNGTPVSFDQNMQLNITPANPGLNTLEISVNKSGEVVSVTKEFYVVDPNDTDAPVVNVLSPEFESAISAPTPLIGSITDNNLSHYSVKVSPVGKQAWTEIATGTSPVTNGELALLDPTLLNNGFYDVVVEAWDLNEQKGSDNTRINVEGDLKVGNFSFTVTDLEIPLAGIPIQVSRTYDSRRRFENLDFGYGWSLGFKDIKLEESRTPGNGWMMTDRPGGPMGMFKTYCMKPAGKPQVVITLPSGQQESFEIQANPECQDLAPAIDVTLSFKPIGSTESKLELVHPAQVRLVMDELTIIGSAETYDPDRYKLTTKEGFVYYIHQHSGLEEIVDPYGHTIKYTQDGIFHSGGQSIQFVRNEKGQIEKIIDPQNNELRYEIDAAGDLKSFSNFEDESTTYSYDGQHGLTDIFDPLNRRMLTNYYDNDGRLFKQVDNQGRETLFDHNLAGRQTVVTDRRHNTTVFTYDDRGNVVNKLDAEGNETRYTYWPNDEKASEEIYGADGSLVSRKTWKVDQATREITELNDNGLITTYTYEKQADGSKKETIVDPELNTFVNYYDPFGTIYRMVLPEDSSGTVKESGSYINGEGQVEWVKNSEEGKTSFTYYLEGAHEDRKKTETDAEGNTTSYTYDVAGNVKTETVEVTIGGVKTPVTTAYEYDRQKRLVKTTYPDGLSTQTFYDLAGNVDYTLDKRSRKTDYRYDMYGRLVETLYPDGSIESKTYDPEGNLETETDRQNRTTRYVYDKLNRRIETHYPDNTVTKLTYDANGNVVQEWDENNNFTLMKFDGAGRLEYSEDLLGNKHRYSYYRDGRVKTETDKNHKTTLYQYNSLGQRSATQLPDKNWLRQSFDTLGRKLSSEDQEGKVTRYGYDKLGRLKTVTETIQGRELVTRYTYDEMGNKLTQQDALNRVTTWTYDKLGRVTSRTLPEMMSERFTYDDMGNVKTHTNFNGKVTKYTYHSQNDRVVREDYDDGSFKAYTYYDAGQIETITTPDGVVRYQYDLRDRLTLEVKANGDTIAYGYDNAGNRTSVTATVNGVSETTTYVYNRLNQLEQVIAPNLQVTTYGYDAAGNLKTVTAENGVVTNYNYDAVHRLDDMQITDPQGVLLESYDYVLRASGRREQVIEGNGRVVTYGYDELYRLTSEEVTDAVNGNYLASYTYDDVGNRKTSLVNGFETLFDYDKNDRLLKAGEAVYSYDDQGNQLSVADGEKQTQNSYNDLNQLISTQTTNGLNKPEPEIRFSYDAKGIRVTRTHNGITTQYLVDHNRDYAQVLAETNDGQTDTRYIYGHDLLKQERAGNSSFFLTDGIGSTRLLADASGQVTDSYDYAAFGELLNHTGSTENAYRYTGEQYDAELDHYYLRARYYDQGVGRFTQMDTWLGKQCTPITLNKYLYAHSDPLTYTDPSGYMSLGSLMTSLNIRGIQSGSAQVSLRFTVRRLSKEVACIIVEEAVIDMTTRAVLNGIYIVTDGSGTYVGQSKNIKNRLKQHARNAAKHVSKRVEDALAIFEIKGGRSDRRLIEQFLIEYWGIDNLTNDVNSIADSPRSKNSKNLRAMLKNKLDLCP